MIPVNPVLVRPLQFQPPPHSDRHPVVVHSFIPSQDRVYTPLLGSELDGASLQTIWFDVHRRTLKWLRDSAATGRPWIVCHDEIGPAWGGLPPDDVYEGCKGITRDGRPVNYIQHDIRQHVIWRNLRAGGMIQLPAPSPDDWLSVIRKI